MPQEALCPSCRQRLLIPEETTERWLTCPRCLTSIRNPNEQVTATPPSGAAPAAEERPRTCPGCGRPIEQGWRTCPYCEEPLLRRRPRTVSPLDRDVHRDHRGGVIVAALLGSMLLIGIVVYLAHGGPAEFLLTPIPLIFGLILVGCIVLAVAGRSTAASVVSGVLGGILLGVLFCLLLLAAICSGLGNVCGPARH